MKIGIVGIGNMGGAMAHCLLGAGQEVYAFDVNRAAVEALEKRGAAGCASPAQLAAQVDYVITSLPNDKILQSVLYEDGLLSGMKKGACLIEMSTILPQTMEKIHADGRALGVIVLDCPVSCGPVDIEKGDMLSLIAGTAEEYAAAKPVLDLLGERQRVFSEQAGHAKALKIVNNTMAMGNIVVASEAFALGVDYGLEPQAMYDILKDCAGRSFHFVKRMPKAIANDYSTQASVVVGSKDLSLSIRLSESIGLSAEVAKAMRSYYDKAIESGYAQDDLIAVYKTFLKKKS